jgi:pimeloyl-ACP methyl ester carboxylesterase/putative sterol carrier protein
MNKEWLDNWRKEINEDPVCQSTGRFFDAIITFGIGEDSYTFHVQQGAVTNIDQSVEPPSNNAFVLTGTVDTWEGLFAPLPAPGYQGIFAAIATGHLAFEGDMNVLLRHMDAFAAWTKAGKKLNGGAVQVENPPLPDSYQAIGRFVNISLHGETSRVFYLEVGQGIPVLLQHTAGNSCEQWHYLLEDRELTKRFRFIAWDLPGHGKSDPRPNTTSDEDHFLTSEYATDFVTTFARTLNLDKPIFIGCSLGGVFALHLAERHPEQFRGLVAMSASIPTSGFFEDWWINPTINTHLMMSGFQDQVTGPDVSEYDRQFNIKSQCSLPRIMRDDVYLWGVENADPGRIERIDASKVPLYMLAGEYDTLAAVEAIEKSAKEIGPEVTFRELKGVGHFAITENYSRFRPVLVEILNEICR